MYDETCKILGQCCLMLASNDEETDRAQQVCQLKRLHRKIMQMIDASHSGVRKATGQPEAPEMYEERVGRRRE
ncbi:DUF2767 domain-containing protein [Phytobacter diazotrophicus]|uniref:DUF2767 domain-containing protein n=1 Tax=Phytobacter diazotrophicus TaxID=395631 RepID=UPI001CC67451|nr:DUF2767 domain-containing protein [Phytobacter diazotrophicus]